MRSAGDYKFSNATWYDFFDQLVTTSLRGGIQYDSPVRKIDYRADTVEVQTTSGEKYQADHVLVMVPICIVIQVRYYGRLEKQEARHLRTIK